MNGEILRIQTMEKLTNYEKALAYIDETLHKSYLASIGKKDKVYLLSTPVILELQTIENILKNGKRIGDKYEKDTM